MVGLSGDILNGALCNRAEVYYCIEMENEPLNYDTTDFAFELHKDYLLGIRIRNSMCKIWGHCLI